MNTNLYFILYHGNHNISGILTWLYAVTLSNFPHKAMQFTVELQIPAATALKVSRQGLPFKGWNHRLHNIIQLLRTPVQDPFDYIITVIRMCKWHHANFTESDLHFDGQLSMMISFDKGNRKIHRYMYRAINATPLSVLNCPLNKLLKLHKNI